MVLIIGLNREVLSGGVSKVIGILPISIYRHLELIKFNILEIGDYNIILGVL
jgi:hypothetical protein